MADQPDSSERPKSSEPPGSTDPMGTTGQVDTAQLNQFFDENFLLMVILAVLLVLLYISASRIARATVPRALETRNEGLDEAGVYAIELEKRTRTLESLTTTLLRLTAVAGLFIIVIGIFGLWSLLTGIALFLAALTLAGQSIVLDYLMGLFIVIEGTFFKGDNIEYNQLRGEVEEVGLRRTVVRGTDGTVHSISNGELRVVSNRTRIYATAEIKVRGIREEDLEAVIAIMERVGLESAAAPDLEGLVIEPHALRFIEDADDLGITAVSRGKVLASARWTVSTDIRRRLNQAFLDEDIELNKRGVAPRGSRVGAGSAPTYVAAAEDDAD